MAAFLMLTCKRQRALGEGLRLLEVASQHMCLPQEETTERLIASPFRGNCQFHRLREQQHGVGNAPSQGVRRAQGRSYPGEKAREVRVLADTRMSPSSAWKKDCARWLASQPEIGSPRRERSW